ncbi:hypothetical protein ALC60_14757 [Trachymyrmex zeteki]|uniref:Uncharacterized protein n=1 Tax=Mycetomoellerius zeteki TaxID=64791 RepID=A0A151WEX3_9HYME|nr:hypothetical protein ALC60_14757 [Trachymyrmex zeteki]
MTRPFARLLREKFRLRPAKPECSTRETHNPEYMTLPLRKGSNVPVEVTASPFTPFEAEGKVELFVGATNVTANEPLLIANFGKFSLICGMLFSNVNTYRFILPLVLKNEQNEKQRNSIILPLQEVIDASARLSVKLPIKSSNENSCCVVRRASRVVSRRKNYYFYTEFAFPLRKTKRSENRNKEQTSLITNCSEFVARKYLWSGNEIPPLFRHERSSSPEAWLSSSSLLLSSLEVSSHPGRRNGEDQ